MRLCPRCSAGHAGATWTCPACGHVPGERDGVVLLAPDAVRSGFDAELFGALAAREEGSFWFRARNALIVDLVEAHFAGTRRFLEIGCGTGYVLSALQRRFGFAATGSELYVEGLSHARARVPEAELVQADARALPYDAEFDLIGAFDVLEHIPEDEVVLRRMARALRPGGGILLSVPQHRWLWSVVDEHAHHVRRYQRRELVARVQRAGFRPVRVTSFVSALLPAMVAARTRDRWSGRPPDVQAELALPPRLDRVLERVLDGERGLIRRGVSLPAGGSLFVAAVLPG